MKKSSLPLLATSLCALTMLSACLELGKTPDETMDTYPTATVGITVSNTTNPFFRSAYEAYEAESKAHAGLTVIMNVANDNQAVQFAQYDEMIAKGAKALVINLADVTQGGEVIKRYCNKVGLVFFNRNPGDKALASCPSAYFVDGDATQAGVLQGLKVLELWKQNPSWDKNRDGIIQYAMLEGIPGHAGAMARTKWAVGTLEHYPNLGVPVESVLQDYAMFNKSRATELVNGWLQHPDFGRVELILANNDSMALGASVALKPKGVKLPIFGIDATTEGLRAVQAGDITATVLNDAVAQAQTSLRLAANLASGIQPETGINYRMQYKVIQVPYQEVQ